MLYYIINRGYGMIFIEALLMSTCEGIKGKVVIIWAVANERNKIKIQSKSDVQNIYLTIQVLI